MFGLLPVWPGLLSIWPGSASVWPDRVSLASVASVAGVGANREVVDLSTAA